MNKLVINHLEKVFITSDAATIVSELEIEHPAAKMLGMAAAQQQSEIGDNSNLVVTLAGELLNQAKELLRMVRYRPKENTDLPHPHMSLNTFVLCLQGVHISEIVTGYKKASVAAMEWLEKGEC